MGEDEAKKAEVALEAKVAEDLVAQRNNENKRENKVTEGTKVVEEAEVAFDAKFAEGGGLVPPTDGDSKASSATGSNSVVAILAFELQEAGQVNAVMQESAAFVEEQRVRRD